MAYDAFAEYYDLLMQNAEYDERTEYILSLFEKFDKVPELLLDLACGTGEFTQRFSARGVDVIGVDPSPEMLQRAQSKMPDSLFLLQSAEQLDLYGTVQGAVCCMDSINHITDLRSLKKAFKRVSLFLEKDRLFIFDVNTVYKHMEILADNTFVIEQEGVFCTWQNETHGSVTDIYLDFFGEREDGSYERISDEFCERAYTCEQLTSALSVAGMRVEAVLDDMSMKKPRKHSERIYFVARKV